MKVWVLIGAYDYDSKHIIAVFATKELAKQRELKIEGSHSISPYAFYETEEHDLIIE